MKAYAALIPESEKEKAVFLFTFTEYNPFKGGAKGLAFDVAYDSVEDMIEEANGYIAKGVYGIDLLGYRYTGNPFILNREFVANVKAPVCIAGSINSYERLQEIKEIAPWSFTIGGAFFENKFAGTFEEQVNEVCRFMRE